MRTTLATRHSPAALGFDVKNSLEELYSTYFSQPPASPYGPPTPPYTGYPALPSQRGSCTLAEWTQSFAFTARGLSYPGYDFKGEDTPERILDLLEQSYRNWMRSPLPGRLYSLHVEQHPLPEFFPGGAGAFFYTASCIDPEGAFMPIGAWILRSSGKEAYMHILTCIQDRGVQDILFFCAQADESDLDYFASIFPGVVFAENAAQLLQPGAPRSKERDFFRFLCRGLGNGACASPEEEMRRAEAACRDVSPEWQALALDATQLVQRLRGRYDFGVRILLLPGTDCLVQYRKPLASTLATRFEKTSTALLHYFSGLAPKLLIRKLQTTRWSCVKPALAQLPCFRNRLDPLPPARDARAFFGTLDFGE